MQAISVVHLESVYMFRSESAIKFDEKFQSEIIDKYNECINEYNSKNQESEE